MGLRSGTFVSVSTRPAASASTRTNLLLDSLVAYWRMDETSTTANGEDAHTNNLDLTVSGSYPIAVVTGVLTNGRAGYGGNNNMSSSDTTFNPMTSFTVSMWFSPSNAPGTAGTMIGKFGTSGNRVWTLYRGTDGTCSFIVCSNGTSSATATTTNVMTNSAVWYHVVGRYDAANYTANVRATPTTSTIPFAQATVANVAGVHSNTTSLFVFTSGGASTPGKIDECGFWRTNLTDVQVTNLWNGGTPLDYSTFD